MVTSAATTVRAYLASLPVERRRAIEAVRRTIRANLPAGYAEEMQYGMIAYNVPLRRYPETYNGQPLAVVALAAQKGHLSLYLMGLYGDPALRRWFERAYRAAGKTLDMGKSCVRFRAVDDLPLEVVGEAIAALPVDAFVAIYERSRPRPRPRKVARETPARVRARSATAPPPTVSRPPAGPPRRAGASSRPARTRTRG